ncbi:MAG: DNA-binding domain-containing protein [Polyangiaceae bacterium]
MSDVLGPEPAAPAELARAQAFLNRAFQRLDPVTDDAALSAACAEFVTGNARMSPARQVEVYREQFWLRHRASLAEDFPALLHFLGEDGFDAFARGYLEAHVPTDPSLRDLPKHIVPFSEGYAFPIDRELALDLVRYEFAFIDVFDGPTPEPLDAARIAAIPGDGWSTARVVLNPCVARLRLRRAAHRICYALKDETKTEPMPSTDPVEGGVRLALYRRDNVVRWTELEEPAFQLLEELHRGRSLVDACAAITADLDEAGIAAIQAKIGAWFAGWASSGFIARIDWPV